MCQQASRPCKGTFFSAPSTASSTDFLVTISKCSSQNCAGGNSSPTKRCKAAFEGDSSEEESNLRHAESLSVRRHDPSHLSW